MVNLFKIYLLSFRGSSIRTVSRSLVSNLKLCYIIFKMLYFKAIMLAEI